MEVHLGGVADVFEQFVDGLGKTLLALTLVAVAAVASYIQKLGLEWDMLWSIFRAFVQLSIIGFVLEFIFVQKGWLGYLLIFLAFCGMVTIAGYTAGTRAKHVPNGKLIAGGSIFVGCAITMVMLILLRVFALTPQYLVPVSGMMVGNAMTVTGVAMKRLREDLRQSQNLVEAALALGATPRQAVSKPMKRSLTLALAPVLDNAKTVGLISLPGAMTGLIMGGASPFEATHLQIVVMNFIIGASTFSSFAAVFMTWPFFFTRSYQLRSEVLSVE